MEENNGVVIGEILIDVKDKISDKDKKELSGLFLECQVLENILKERQGILQGLVHKVTLAITPHPELYVLHSNTSKNEWDLKLKQGGLIVPGQLPKNS